MALNRLHGTLIRSWPFRGKTPKNVRYLIPTGWSDLFEGSNIYRGLRVWNKFDLFPSYPRLSSLRRAIHIYITEYWQYAMEVGLYLSCHVERALQPMVVKQPERQLRIQEENQYNIHSNTHCSPHEPELCV